MDLIKLYSISFSPSELNAGEAISGHTSVLWVERYREPGEFKIVAPLSSGLLTDLPIGSFITHQETPTVMIVENHEINQPEDADSTITITGRCATSFMENRTVGDDVAFATDVISDYILAADQTWDQAVTLIDDHLINATDPDDLLNGFAVMHTCSGPVTVEERAVKPTNVHQAVTDILKIDDLGMKTVRPTSSVAVTYFVVYRGNDVSTKVRFSWMRGDIDSADYFFSNKKLYTQARVMGRWMQVVVNPTGANNYDRRTMIVDAAYLDERQTAFPTGTAHTWITAAMMADGHKALKAQKEIAITSVDISENANVRFRRDYNIGDLVTVDGDFGTSQVMRVVEYAETDDETGSRGHPTLAIPGE